MCVIREEGGNIRYHTSSKSCIGVVAESSRYL
jgi:hypothetical protein